MSVEFRKIRRSMRLINPFKDFTLDEIPFEIRYDPLTGESGRVFHLPFKAPAPPGPEEWAARDKDQFCPFCPAVLEKATPLFPEELIPGGRVRVGEASVVPNLVPFDTIAAVAVFSHRHFVELKALTSDAMRDVFVAALTFIRRAAAADPGLKFFNLNWNFMPPAGSSILHPHLQINCGEAPTNAQRLQSAHSEAYRAAQGRLFWADFTAAEKEAGERYLAEIGDTFWCMSFAPLGFLPDVSCVFKEDSSLLTVGPETLDAFLDGLARVLRYFEAENLYSFNVAVFGGREAEHFRVNAKICPRVLPRPIGNSDHSYLQTLHKEPFTIRWPEAVCRKMRPFF